MANETNKYQLTVKKENQSELERLIYLIGASIETKINSVYTLNLTIGQMIVVMGFTVHEKYAPVKDLVDKIETELNKAHSKTLDTYQKGSTELNQTRKEFTDIQMKGKQ